MSEDTTVRCPNCSTPLEGDDEVGYGTWGYCDKCFHDEMLTNKQEGSDE